MRQEIFDGLRDCLLDDGSVVKHVSLWNENVVFAEEDEPWDRPAVFVEFSPIAWESVKERSRYHTRSRIVLHVVTDWSSESELPVFEVVDGIVARVDGLCGEHFGPLRLVESQTNHNHEDLVESIEVFEYRGWREELRVES